MRERDVRIELRGELDRAAARELGSALAAAEASDADFLLLDLRRLRSIDASGVRAILTTHHRLGQHRALLLIRGAQPVEHLLETADVEPPLFLLD